jgi:hypothetical protein
MVVSRIYSIPFIRLILASVVLVEDRSESSDAGRIEEW